MVDPGGRGPGPPSSHRVPKPGYQWPGTCSRPVMANLGKVVVAGIGAKMLTGSLVGFALVFLLILWLLGGL